MTFKRRGRGEDDSTDYGRHGGGIEGETVGHGPAGRRSVAERLARARSQMRAAYGTARSAIARRRPLSRALAITPQTGRALSRLTVRPIALRLPNPELGKWPRRTCSVVREALAGAMVLGIVLVLVVYSRVGSEPVSFPMLIGPVERGISAALPGFQVRVGDAVLRRSSADSGLEFRLLRVRVIDADGDVVAEAPEAAVSLSGAALLAGQLAPSSVQLIGPRLLLASDQARALFGGGEANAGDGGSDEALPKTNAADEAVPSGSVIRHRPDRRITIVEKLPGDPGAGASPAPVTRVVPRRSALAATISQALAQARDQQTAGAFLKSFGLRNAMIIVDHGRQQSYWRLLSLDLSATHADGASTLSGTGQWATSAGPWRFSFAVSETRDDRSLALAVRFLPVSLSALAEQVPQLAAIEAADLPISGEAEFAMTPEGDVRAGQMAIVLGGGAVVVDPAKDLTVAIDGGRVALSYDAAADRVLITDARVVWGKSQIALTGTIEADQGENLGRYRFGVQDAGSVLADAPLQGATIAPLRFDRLSLAGTIAPQSDAVAQLTLTAGEATLAADMRYGWGKGADDGGGSGLAVDGQLRAMPVEALVRLWPKPVAPGGRVFVSERISTKAGQWTGVRDGAFRVRLSPEMLADPSLITAEAIDVRFAAENVTLSYVRGLPPVEIPAATGTIAGRTMTLAVARGTVAVAEGQAITVKDSAFIITGLGDPVEDGRVDLKAEADAKTVLAYLDAPKLGYVTKAGLGGVAFGGAAQAALSFQFPLLAGLTFDDVVMGGSAAIKKLKMPALAGKMGVDDGTIEFGLSRQAIQARGEVFVRDVRGTLDWQYIFDADDDRQPGLRVQAVLDDAARDSLGLKMNHILRGPVSAALGFARDARGAAVVRVQADLREAELLLANLSWRKPPGQAAVVQFDGAKTDDGLTELRNFQIAGEAIAVQGWVALNAENRLAAFYFPEFSINIITNLEISGTLRKDKVWQIKARGPAYDGRGFLQSLFSSGKIVENQPEAPADRTGLDLDAQIGTMIGYSNTSIRNLRVQVSKRDGQLSSLDAAGAFENGRPIAVQLVNPPNGERHLIAETSDAGSAFRLMGLYRSMEGGEASVRVNLDAKGAAERSGVIWARRFAIVGDQVVSEVLSNVPEDQRKIADRAGVQYQRLQFDQMRVPFSVGHGQLVLNDSYLAGPAMGATLRGRVDFKSQRLDLGGSYSPLYGLSAIVQDIPLIGALLTGGRGEGILGLTFAARGPIDNPQVIANPASIVAPGIFRRMFDMTTPQPRIIVRSDEPPPEKPAEPARAPVITDGWTARENRSN